MKNPGNGRLNNLNDPVLNVLSSLCRKISQCKKIPVHAMKPRSKIINTDPLILNLSTEVSGYSYAPAPFHTGRSHGTHRIRGRMGLRAGVVFLQETLLPLQCAGAVLTLFSSISMKDTFRSEP